MFKRALFILTTIAALSCWPIVAQELASSSVDFVPADFAAFIQVRMHDPDTTIQDLNVAAFVASRLQPTRVLLDNAGLTYDALIPLAPLFDVDIAPFLQVITPWLGDDMVIAYREFDGQLGTDSNDTLLIFSTSNLLEAASRLSALIEAQDLLEKQVYRGITVYVGDKTSIAITAPAVFIGSTDVIHAALDVQAGVSESMSDSPVQAALWGTFDETPLVYAYVDGDHVLPAVSGLLGGQPSTEGLLSAFGGALSQLRGDDSFEALLLNGGFDAAAASVNVTVDSEELYVNARAVFHTRSAPVENFVAESENNLTDMIPQNALLVGTGADAQGMIYNVLTALPMSNFAREIFAGLPIQTVGTASEQIIVPDAGQVSRAVKGYLTLLEQFQDFNLETDFLDYLSGDYVMALMPRPNDPVPVLNTPFDVLVVARVNDESALAGAITLLQTMLNLESLDNQTIDDWDFNRLGLSGQVVVSLGIVDDVLMIGTSDVIGRVLAARKGDNRLSKQKPWQVLSEAETPGLYLDSFVFLNTFFPSPGGTVPSTDNRTHFALNSHYLGGGLFELVLTAALPNT